MARTPLLMTGDTLTLPAPAKMNLFLHVTGRRADGLHTLQTVFQFIDFADTLVFGRRDDARIRLLEGAPGVPAERDLVMRAARALQARAGRDAPGADIRVRKRVPMGGGLGGGSSDAATTLVALNHLWGLGLDAGELARIGLSLGADVPVFVRGEAAWAEGVGEILTPMTLPEPWYLVVDPGVSVATAEVFQAPDLTRNSPHITIDDFVWDECRNDCEPVAAARHPEIAEALQWLSRFGRARMTGTGASVFVPFESQESAWRAKRALPGRWPGFVARGMNRSPLRTAMEAVVVARDRDA